LTEFGDTDPSCPRIWAAISESSGREGRYGALVYPAVLVAVLRIGERLVFAGELKSAFGIGMDRTIGTIIVVGVLNLALLVLKPRTTYPPAT
jgi:hypothetical protein